MATVKDALSLGCMGLLLASGMVGPRDAIAQSTEPVLRIEAGAHTGVTDDVATDANGSVLVTVGRDKTARVWSLPDLQPRGVFRPPIGPYEEGFLYSVAVSPDGRTAAVGGWTGPHYSGATGKFSLFLFDLNTGQVVRHWTGLEDVIIRLAFSSDGRRLAVGLGGGAGVRVLDVNGGEVFRDTSGFSNHAWVTGLSFAPDLRLAAADYNGTIRLYDHSGARVRVVRDGPRGHLGRIAFSPDGRELAVGLADADAVEIRDGYSLAPLLRPDTSGLIGARGSNMYDVAWSRDGDRLYGGGDASGGRDPSLILSGGERRLIFSWDRRGRGKRAVAIDGFTDNVTAITTLPAGGVVGMALDGDLVIGDATNGPRAERRRTTADFRGPVDFADPAWRFYLNRTGQRVVWDFPGSTPIWHAFDVQNLDISTSSFPPSGLTDSTDRTGKLRVSDWRSSLYPRLNGRLLPPLNANEPSRSVAAEDDRVLLGTEYSLRLFGSTGQARWRQPTPGVVWRVNQSPDGRLAVAALSDGTIRWYRLRDGQELLAVFFTRNADRWVAFTPSGYYAASPGGEDLVGWQVNRGPDQAADFFPASRFHDRFYRPDVVRLVLQTLDEDVALTQANAASGRNEPKVAAATIVTQLPPVLDLVSAPTRFATDHVTIQYRVRTPADAPMIGDPRIKVNGEWQPKSRAASQVAADGTRDLIVESLPPHDSTVEIYADNRNARSVPLTFALKWDGAAALAPGQQGLAAEHKPHLFVLAVGVSQYQRPDLRLNFADHDAEQFVAAMEAQRGRRYAEVTTKLLVDGKATLSDVKAGLAWLASQAAADDVGVLFLAGHGVQTPDQSYFFAPADFDPARQRETGVDYKTIRGALDTFSTAGNRVLFFVDTCYAGGALGPNLAASNGAALAAVLSRPDYGIIVLSASKGSQLSYEDPKWGDGAFTTALLEGIVQAKADAAQTGEITILNLGGYVTQRVRVLTQQRQEPMFIMPGGSVVDFAVASH